MANIIIYTTPTCSFCHMAKEFFQNNNIYYTEKDVSEGAELQTEMIEKSGQMGTPVIDIDGQIVVGFDKIKLKELLKL